MSVKPPAGYSGWAEYHDDYAANAAGARLHYQGQAPATADVPEFSADERHLGKLLNALVDFIRAYVVLSATQADADALWVAHTHALDAFETTPFLKISSPEKRCGKSRLLDVLELVVARPWRTIMPSEAVLYRKIDAVQPTLMLDECDAIFNDKSGKTEPLRALLNAGNRRGTRVPRCVGPRQQLVDFDVFCAKVLVGTASCPTRSPTARSRTDSRASAPTRPCGGSAAVRPSRSPRRSTRHSPPGPRPPSPRSRPLDPRSRTNLTTAPRKPGNRCSRSPSSPAATGPSAHGEAALNLSGSRADEDEALGVWLLRDIRAVFDELTVNRLSSLELARALNEIETSPWGDIRGKPLDSRSLARRLKPFEIKPRTVRFADGSTAKGYHRDQFEDAFTRYLTTPDRHNVTTAPTSQEPIEPEPPAPRLENTSDPAPAPACDDVTDKTRAEATQPLLRLGDRGYALQIDAAFAAGLITGREVHEQIKLDAKLANERRNRRLPLPQHTAGEAP